MKSYEKRLSRVPAMGLTVLLTIFLANSFSVASTLHSRPTSTGAISTDPTISTGTVLPNFAVVSVGPNASLMVNSGPITGTVLIGNGSKATSAGGGNGAVTGGVDVSGTVTGDNLQSLNTKPVVRIVPASVGQQAFADAATLSSTAAGLAATQTFGAISGTQTITGNGGLNVINVASLSNPTLTISGTAKDIFVFNVAGQFSTNRTITLQGVTASQILWNFTGTGTVFSTSGGNLLFGTFLATNGGSFQFSSLNLTGALINTAGHIQFVSNSKLTFDPFRPPSSEVIPEPTSLLLLGTGLVVGAGVLRRSSKSSADQMPGDRRRSV